MRKWLCGVWLTSVLVCLNVQAQNDLMLSSPLPADPAVAPAGAQPAAQPAPVPPPPPSSPVQAVPAPEVVVIQADPNARLPAPAVTTTATPLPPPPAGAQIRMVLLLPRKSPAFKVAAEAVHQGFMQALNRDPDPRIALKLVESGDDPRDVLAAYQDAQADADIVIGPLTRSGVSAIATRARIEKTTLALAHADMQGEREAVLPPKLLPIGLSVEDEARQMAQQLAAEHPGARAWILSGPSAWQRRAARAFELQWRQLRQLSDKMEIHAAGNLLDISALQQLHRRLETEQPGLIFAALDVDQASQVREATGTQALMAGTSLLNPLPAGDWPVSSRRPEMDGVRLLDLPWLVQPSNPAVMAYKSTDPARRSAELERLFALGVDAGRLARELAAGKTAFELDGVTGRLKVDFNAPSLRFTRQEVPAEYRNGMVMSDMVMSSEPR